jgi:hypothetical protein
LEEKDELIEKTKKSTIDKYGVGSSWYFSDFISNSLS